MLQCNVGVCFALEWIPACSRRHVRLGKKKPENLNMYKMKQLHHGKCLRTIFIHSFLRTKKLTRSLCSLVRFFGATQLVNKYRSKALSVE